MTTGNGTGEDQTQITRILLVGDDQNYCNQVKDAFAELYRDCDFEQVTNYDDGLKALLRRNHDVCLVEYQIGNRSGLDLVREAVTQGVDTPLIIVSGQEHAQVHMDALRAGATDHLQKTSIVPTELYQTITRALIRAEARRKLRAREDWYRALIEESLDSIIVTDLDGKIVFANAACVQLLGIERATIRALPVEKLIHPDDSQVRLPDAQDVTSVEARFGLADGNQRQVEFSIRRVKEHYRQFVIRDISRHRRSIEKRDRHIEQLTILRQVDDELSQITSIDAVLALAIDASVRLSAATAGYIGLTVPDQESAIQVAQIIGSTTLVHPGDKISKSAYLRSLLEEGDARLISDMQKTKTGLLPVSPDSRVQMILPIRSHENVLGVLHLESYRSDAFTEDTLDFMKLMSARIGIALENAQLYQVAQDQLQELQKLYTKVSGLEQLKSDMIRIAAHDLRNPLNVITTSIALLRRSDDETKHTEYLDQQQGAANQMKRIISDILSLERIEQMQDSDGEVLDLNELVEDAVEIFRTQAEAKAQRLTAQTPDTAALVRADPAQLREGLANLINNAIKYTPYDGQIRVRVFRDADEIVLDVEDNGYGVAEDQQEKLFNPFYRAQSPETLQIEGNGLGLYLVKNIVERFHGSIIFESTYGEGSTFGFRLPAVDRE